MSGACILSRLAHFDERLLSAYRLVTTFPNFEPTRMTCCVQVAASPALSLSSRTNSSTCRPARPRASLDCFAASSALSTCALASAAKGPAGGVANPMRIGEACACAIRGIPTSVVMAINPILPMAAGWRVRRSTLVFHGRFPFVAKMLDAFHTCPSVRNKRSGDIGSLETDIPSGLIASLTAFMAAADAAAVPASPQPFAPSSVSRVGVSTCAISMSGISAAIGTR